MSDPNANSVVPPKFDFNEDRNFFEKLSKEECTLVVRRLTDVEMRTKGKTDCMEVFGQGKYIFALFLST